MGSEMCIRDRCGCGVVASDVVAAHVFEVFGLFARLPWRMLHSYRDDFSAETDELLLNIRLLYDSGLAAKRSAGQALRRARVVSEM